MKQHITYCSNKYIFNLLIVFLILSISNCKKDKPDSSTNVEVEYLQSGILYDNEGNIYKTVIIGQQEWMAQNLNTTIHDYGSSWCYENDTANCRKYGRLYNWDAIMNGEPTSYNNPSGVRGICPAGWHVPSDAEWRQLEMFLGMTQEEANSNSWRGTDQGTKLKSKMGWDSNGNGTDYFAFSALPGGGRSVLTNVFIGKGFSGNWWSTTWGGSTIDSYIKRSLDSYQSGISRSSISSDYAASLRCVKN